MLGREGRLVALINEIVNDKSVANDIAEIELNLKSFSSRIDTVQKVLLLRNSLKKASNNVEKIIAIAPFFFDLAGKPLPGEVEAVAGATSVKIKPLTINFNPLQALFEYSIKDLTASNIADWITGASQAVANAKLQDTEQRANVVKQLSENLRETRNALKQLDVAIQQTTQQKQQFQAQITANQQEISKAELNIQQLQEKSNINQQQIAQIDQQIQQTNSEIAAKQQQLEQNGQQLKDAKESIDMNKADTSENQEKINQLAQDANQMKTQQNQTSNVPNSGRAEPLSSNIFLSTSMRQ